MIDAEYKGDFSHNTNYILWKENSNGCGLTGILWFGYSGEDTISLTLVKNDTISRNSVKKNEVIDKLRFVKKAG